jgi:hypothetical protein
MNRARLAQIGTSFAIARLKWLQAFACFTAGWVACAAFVHLLAYAPQVALGLIQQVSGVL